jgi:hypothetical protein
MKAIDYRSVSARSLVTLGGAAMLGGAVDPLEGSLAILIGSGMFALGTFLGHSERRKIAYRVGVFVLIVMGVGAMWVMSNMGGIGGNSGRSMWWGVLILPYLIGWSMGIWGAGSPRWVVWMGLVAGLWYLALAGIVLKHPNRPGSSDSIAPIAVIGGTGLLTVVGCIRNLIKRK